MSKTRTQEVRTALRRALQGLSAGRNSLDLIEDIPALETFIDDYATARIADARAEGASWADIARRLGVSKQAVHKRFAKRPGRSGRSIIELRFIRD